jgi:hypothetical protein
MGRWSAAHWKTATFGWLAFVLVAFGLGGAVVSTGLGEWLARGVAAGVGTTVGTGRTSR